VARWAGGLGLTPATLEFWIPKREENRRTPCWVPHGSQRGDVEIRTTFRDSAGPRSLVFDLRIAHDRFGSSSHVLQNGLLTHTQYLDGPLRVAAQRKSNAYGQQYADNQNISFLPAIISTSCRMHGEFLRLIFLQAPIWRPRRISLQLQLECHRKTTKLNGRVPFQARGVPSVTEDQDRPSSLQSGGVEDQPQYPGLRHSGSPSARSFSRSPSPPPPSFTTISPPPAFASA